MLELMITRDDHDRNYVPVTADLVDELRQILADGVNGGYDIDAVLFQLARAIVHLETKLLERQTQIINLERRILEAGLLLEPAD